MWLLFSILGDNRLFILLFFYLYHKLRSNAMVNNAKVILNEKSVLMSGILVFSKKLLHDVFINIKKNWTNFVTTKNYISTAEFMEIVELLFHWEFFRSGIVGFCLLREHKIAKCVIIEKTVDEDIVSWRKFLKCTGFFKIGLMCRNISEEDPLVW